MRNVRKALELNLAIFAKNLAHFAVKKNKNENKTTHIIFSFIDFTFCSKGEDFCECY
jgi:hypothetical protein